MDRERQKNAMVLLKEKQSKTGGQRFKKEGNDVIEEKADKDGETGGVMSLRGKQSKTKSIYCLFDF